ncbi:MAG: alginate lyase family protein [Asticcacaulis sp.]|uniref:alginate lyase family protein n=1 Tax=Asticcacaulis sp. TaxID=1872648 RepID=UPI0039E3DDB9
MGTGSFLTGLTMDRRRLLAGLGAIAAFPLTGASCSAETTLHPPFAVPFPDKKAGKAKSVPAVEPIKALSNESRYRRDDPTRSIVDPELSAAYDEAVAPLRTFSKAVVKSANRFVSSGGKDLEAAAQVSGLIGRWADAGALKDASSETAYFSRLSALNPAALALLQVQNALKDADFDRCDDWIRSCTSDTRAYYSGLNSQSSRNNHRYWAGLAVLASGIAGNRSDDFDWGVDAARIGLEQVTDEGVLPLELKRGQKALSYHAYALGPLVMIAEAAACNGNDDLYAMNEDALHRLVDFTLSQIDDPDRIARLAGIEQERLGANNTTFDPVDIAWLEIYESRFPGRSRWSSRMKKIRPLSASGLGGNLTLLFAGQHDDDDPPDNKSKRG